MIARTSALPPESPGGGWQLYAEANPFVRHIGPIWQSTLDGRHEYAFRVEQVHSNLYGIVHGGMIAAFVDHTLGQTAFESFGRRPTVTVHSDVSFISPARLGDFVCCRVAVTRKTQSLIFLRGELSVDTRCVAKANGIWKVLGARSGETFQAAGSNL